MSVPVQDTVFTYTANGSTDTFAYQCYVLLEGDLQVYLDGVLQTSGYTVTGLGNQGGGTVVFSTDPVDGTSVVLMRSLPLKRDIDYAPLGDLRSDTVDEDFDRVWMALQDRNRDFTRSIRYLPSEELDGTLPAAGSRAGKLLGFDSAGRHTMIPLPASVGAGDMKTDTFVGGVDFTAGVTTQLTLSRAPGTPDNLEIHFDGVYQGPDQWTVAGAVVTFTSPIQVGTQRVYARTGTNLSVNGVDDVQVTVLSPVTGGVPRTQHDKNRDYFTALDVGVIGDGVTEDLPALQAAASNFPGPVILPAGKQYKLGGAVSILGSETLWDELAAGDTPYDTARIQRTVNAVGSTAHQTGGHIIRSSIGAGVAHHEFGYFSVIDSRSTAALEHVGMYSQISSNGDGASVIWAGVDEVKNVQPDGTGTTVNHAMAAREVDVVNKFAFSDILKKIGVECIAWGGGESTEAFSVYAANNTRGNGTYATGHWRYAFRVLGNAIDAANGIGLQILSSNGSGIQIVGASSNYGIHLAADAASPVGMNVEANYTTPIAVPANKQINLNGVAGTQGIQFASGLGAGAVILQGAGIGVTGHVTSSAAAVGGATALPATPEGYLTFWVNGIARKVPFFN